MADYYVIPTSIGEAKMAGALALGVPLEISELALGDGEGAGARNTPVPDSEQTALVSERRRAPINSFMQDPENGNVLIAEQIVPEDVGGFWIREMGLFDADGDLIFVCNAPPTYKPQLEEGSGRTQVVRMAMIVSDVASVSLQVDPSVVVATREYAQQLLVAHEEDFQKKLDRRVVHIVSITEDFSGRVAVEGQKISASGWTADSEDGAAFYVGRASRPKSEHDGVNVISPTVPALSAQPGAGYAEKAANFLAGNGEADVGGSGVWVKTGLSNAPFYDVVIVYGQSNAVGFAGQPGAPAADSGAAPEPGKRSLQYDPASDSIVTISNTMNHLNYLEEGTSSRGNAWTAFANRYVELTGRGVVIVNAARGGKTIAELSKGAGTGDTDYYQVLLDGFAAAEAAMNSANLLQGNTYLVFHQGESDQSAGTGYVAYRDALNTLVKDLQTDIPKLDRFGVCIVGCPDSRPQESWQRIQAAQYAAVAYGEGSPEVAAVIYEGCPTFRLANGQYNAVDLTHYSQRGYNQMGEGAASGLVRWALGSTRSSSEEDAHSRHNVRGVGYLPIQKVSAVAALSAGSWSLLRKSNTPTSSAIYPCYVETVSTTADAVRFKMNGKAAVSYDYSVALNQPGLDASLFAYVSSYTSGGTEWGFDVKFKADIYFAVDTSTGVILTGAPLGSASSFVSSIVSVSTDGTTATIVHPEVNSVPEVWYGSTGGFEAGYAGVRSTASNTTKITSSGPSNVVNIVLRRVDLTTAQLNKIPGGQLAIQLTAHVSDDV